MSIKLKCISVFIILLVIPSLYPYITEAALPANEQWRLSLMDECVGYPCATLQALNPSNWNHCVVTNTNDTGAGSLRTCLTSTAPRWITFGTLTGTISVDTVLKPSSNTVIDGRTANITISTGPNFDEDGSSAENVAMLIGCYIVSGCQPVSNVVVTYLQFRNIYAGGALVVMERAQFVWAHHLDFQNSIDDLLWISCGNFFSNYPPGCQFEGGAGANRAPRDITVSWNHFLPKSGTPRPDSEFWDCAVGEWCSKGFLLGSYASNESVLTVTSHHNWFASNDRHPAMSDAQYHAFNNFYDGRNSAGGSNTNVCQNADFRSENEVLLLGGFGNPMIAGNATFCGIAPNTSIISCTGNLYIDGAACEQRLPGSIFTPPYSYTLETANTALRTAIETNAGWQLVTAPGSTPPTLSITTPTSSSTYRTIVSSVTLSGPATDDVGVTSVTWTCPTCTPTSGTASCSPACGAAATSTTWTISSIQLSTYDNIFTVTANDGDLQTAQDVLTVTYFPNSTRAYRLQK